MSVFPKNALPEKKFKTINGKKMAYVEVGEGDPIVFLHGVPTSSYLWRNIMPYLEGKGRLIAPDLIGMGDSEKLDNTGHGSYSVPAHASYLFPLLEELGCTENVTLILHDWGSGLGFHYANTHRDAIKGIAFMEGIPAIFPEMADFPKGIQEVIGMLRSAEGDVKALEENFFIETLLPAAILRDLTEEEHAEYRRPFPIPGGPRRRSGANWKPGRPSRTDFRIACQMCSVAGPIHGISSCKVAARTSASCSLETLETVAPFCSLRRALRSLVPRCCIPVAASCRSTYLKARLSILILSCVEREFL